MPTTMTQDLSTLACYAAIEIESFRVDNTKESSFVYVEALAKYLKENTEFTDQDKTVVSKLNPTTMVAISKAFSESNPTKDLRDINGLLEASDDIVTRLGKLSTSDISGNLFSDNLEMLRDFCLALAQQSTSYETSLYDESH